MSDRWGQHLTGQVRPPRPGQCSARHRAFFPAQGHPAAAQRARSGPTSTPTLRLRSSHGRPSGDDAARDWSPRGPLRRCTQPPGGSGGTSSGWYSCIPDIRWWCRRRRSCHDVLHAPLPVPTVTRERSELDRTADGDAVYGEGDIARVRDRSLLCSTLSLRPRP